MSSTAYNKMLRKLQKGMAIQKGIFLLLGGGAIVLKYLFIIFLVALGVAAAASHSFSLGPTGMPMWANFLVGGAGSLCAAWLLVSAWHRSTAVNEKKTITRLINSLLVGLSFAVIGTILLFSLGFIFPAGIGVRIAQGTTLIVTLLLGLCVGYRLETSILSPFLPGPGAKLVDKLSIDDNCSCKVLDTSAIIDGRIALLVETGFLEGEICVPEFVLSEL